MMSQEPPVYLDYAATTPTALRVLERMRDIQTNSYGNPSSNHVLGRRSAAVVEQAAKQLGQLLNVDPVSLFWTSGGTESNNLAIAGVARQRAHRGRHIVTMRTEHKAVVDVCQALQKQGYEVTWLPPGADGRVSATDLASALRDDTQLVSIMHINNETGIEQDIAALGSVCREHGVLFHVDGAQSVGKVPLDLGALPVDLLSLTGHKFYGPKGIGALYVASDTPLLPLMFGGGQQRRLRPGTLPVELIAGLGEAAELAVAELPQDSQRLVVLRDQLWRGLSGITGLHCNSDPETGYPGILNVDIEDLNGESLMLALEPLCVASGSACNSQSQEPSYVLRALGRSDAAAQSAIRFSLGRQTTAAHVEYAIATYTAAVRTLRARAPATVA